MPEFVEIRLGAWRTRRRRSVLLRAVVALCVAACVAHAQPAAAAVAWMEPAAPARLVFAIPPETGMHTLVAVPMTNRPPDTAFAVYGNGSTALPYRVVLQNERTAYLLVATGGPVLPPQPCAVYFGRPGTNRLETATLSDPLPVGVSIRPSTAQGIPSNWDRMLYMASQKTGATPVTFRQHYFGAIEPPAGLDFGGNPARAPALLVKAQTWFLCAKDGPYRFAVDCRDAGFVVVDGELAAARPGEGEADGWRTGAPVRLSRGLHRLEVFAKSKGIPCVRVGWQPPGETAVQPIPFEALIASALATQTRLERQDDPVHTDFTFTIGQPYAFRNSAAVFTPVEFLSRETSYGKGFSIPTWSFGDGAGGQGYRVRHVYQSNECFAVAMRVNDSNGRVYGSEGVVDCRYGEPRSIAVSAQLLGVPAVLYAEDPVEPVVRVAGPEAGLLPATLRWVAESVHGAPARGSGKLQLQTAAVNVPLPAQVAGAVTCLRWELLHNDVTIAAETVRFRRPPFAEVPTAVLGAELLAANGDRLALVPHRYAGDFKQRVIAPEDVARGVLCVDDALAEGADASAPAAVYPRLLKRFMAEGGVQAQVEHRRLQDWCEMPSAYGPLLTVVAIAQAAGKGTGVVVISVGRQDVTWRTDPAEFERLLAAAVDAVSATTGRPVVLVTPPAYPSLGAAVRPYAAAVINVAVARGIPAADVFSACMGAGPERAALFSMTSDLTLSGAGQRLAARLVADALCRAQERQR